MLTLLLFYSRVENLKLLYANHLTVAGNSKVKILPQNSRRFISDGGNI